MGLEQEFLNRVEEGFQVTPTWHQGCIRDNGRYVWVLKLSFSAALHFCELPCSCGRGFHASSCGFPGRIMLRLCLRLGGSTARVRFTGGVTRAPSRRPPRDGWPRFLSLNLTGRFAWRVVFPQVRCAPLSQFKSNHGYSFSTFLGHRIC